MRDRHKLNAPGPWYCIDPFDPSGDGCTACGLCSRAAPEFFREDDEGNAYVWKQPITDAEISLCTKQRMDCPHNSISMTTYSESDAYVRVTSHLESKYGPNAAILRFEEHVFGWAFYCNSKKYIETRNDADMWIGAGVGIFDKYTGKIFLTGSRSDPKIVINNYKNFKQISPNPIDYMLYFFRKIFKVSLWH